MFSVEIRIHQTRVHRTRILYPTKLSFKCKGEIKFLRQRGTKEIHHWQTCPSKNVKSS